MSGFDPDKFLASDSPDGFDPDQFIAGGQEKSTLKQEDDSPGLFDRIAANAREIFSGDSPRLEKLRQIRDENAKQELENAVAAGGVVHGATLGYEPQIIGGVKSLVEGKPYVDARDEVIRQQETLKHKDPRAFFAGEMAGGVLPGMLIPGSKAVTSVKDAAKLGAKTGALYGALANPGDTLGRVDMSGQLGQRAVNTALGIPTGAAMGVAGYGIGKGLATVGDAIQTRKKANLADIEAASQALDIKPTAGMTTEGKFVSNLESSLDQSPSIAGVLMRRKTNQVRQGLGKASDKLFADASGLTDAEAGQLAKGQIMARVGERSGPLEMSYDEIGESTRNALVNPKSTQLIGRNIRNIDEVKLTPGSEWANKAEKYSDWLQNAKTVDQLKQLRTLVGQDIKTAEGPEKFVLGQIYDKITKLRQRALLAAAQENAATPGKGKQIAEELIQQIKQTDDGWRSMMSDLGKMSEYARLGKTGGPKGFTEAVESIKPEAMADRFFNLGDSRLRGEVKTQFPDAAETLRQQKLAGLLKQSLDPQGEAGAISHRRMTTAIDKMHPEAKVDLFGENQVIPEQVKTVLNAIPKDINPSKTSVGEAYKQTLNPMFQASELGRYGMYKAIESGAANRIGQMLMRSPQFSALAAKNPAAFKELVNRLGGRIGENRVKRQTPLKSEEEARDAFLMGQ